MLAAAALVSSACSSSRGQLVVAIHSDLEVPAELGSVLAIVRASPSATPVTRAFDLASGGATLPLSFVVRPREGQDSAKDVIVEVEGHRSAAADDAPIVTRRAVTSILAGDTRVLRMFLARSCVGRACVEGETCTEAGCVSEQVAASTLPELASPGDELVWQLGFDAGPDFDGGPDLDAGPPPPRDGGACIAGSSSPIAFAPVSGSEFIWPLLGAPADCSGGCWTYNEPATSPESTSVEWSATAPPGCAITRIAFSLPELPPDDPDRLCVRPGRCAGARTDGATYAFRTPAGNELHMASQQAAGATLEIPLTTPAATVTAHLGDRTSETVVGEAYLVLHTATFYWE